jgi:hypothetical protein
MPARRLQEGTRGKASFAEEERRPAGEAGEEKDSAPRKREKEERPPAGQALDIAITAA